MLFFKTLLAVSMLGATDRKEEILYNGIRLPAEWPPRSMELTREIETPPYLVNPPEVIPIDVGRQLFVDDFLIQKTDLERVYPAAEYHPETPVLVPDKPWEKEGKFPTAMVFSDGVWYDPEEKLFKMWYMGGYVRYTCYATSKDGLEWIKPELDIRKGTNIVDTGARDSSTVWLDAGEKDLSRRYKMVYYPLSGHSGKLAVFYSKDGIHWGDPVVRTGPCGDRTSVFYNPFRKVWVYSLREYLPGTMGRCRRYWEHEDLVEGAAWREGEPALWVGADERDYERQELNTPCELYNLDVVAYESLLLGLFTIWRGQPKDRAKPNEVLLGFSRDGFHWFRPSHSPFLPVSETAGDWNWANVQSASGGCLVVGDELWFYVSGRQGEPGSSGSGICSTGLATIRRDGFAAVAADDARGTLTTRLVSFEGKHLFVNVDSDEGLTKAEVLGEDNQPLEGLNKDRCLPIQMDDTCLKVEWKGIRDLSAIAGQSIRFRFHLENARLYSFWVTPDASGASRGYVAAGGPGFVEPRDTVGGP